jgi:hypothetical protein
VLWNSNKRLQRENARINSNLEAITKSIYYVRTQNGKLAAQTDALLLHTNELKKLFPIEAKSIDDLGVKIGRATQLSTTIIESQKNIVTLVRDSIVHDTVRVKVFSYQDHWYHTSPIR